jgi:hypothetical protein
MADPDELIRQGQAWLRLIEAIDALLAQAGPPNDPVVLEAARQRAEQRLQEIIAGSTPAIAAQIAAAGNGAAGSGPNGALSDERLARALQILTTEHFNLQTARSIAATEASSRSGLYLSILSNVLVVLAFIGQISQLGTAFFVFALILFPALFFLGLVTFNRVLQSALEDILYLRGMNRIRHFFGETAPEIRDYFILSSADDSASVNRDLGVQAVWWQVFLTMPGMVAVVNSLLAGVFVGLLGYQFASLALPGAFLVGFGAFLLVLIAFYRYQWITWGNAQRRVRALFPSDPAAGRTHGPAAAAARPNPNIPGGP